jgi:hypothetical protein
MFRRRPYRQCAVTRLNELSFSDLRQRPRLAYRSHGPGTREATIYLVDDALPNHQKDASHPARRRRPAELPAMIGYINGSESRPAPQNPDRLPPQPCQAPPSRAPRRRPIPSSHQTPGPVPYRGDAPGRRSPVQRLAHPSQVPLRVPLTAGEVPGSKFERSSRPASPLTESNRRPSPYHLAAQGSIEDVDAGQRPITV